MKRARFLGIIVVMVIVLSLALTGYSQDVIGEKKNKEKFEIRNGITFGLTVEQVKEIEGEEGVYSDGVLEFEREIAGQPNTTVYYYFENEMLVEVKYSFDKRYVNQYFYDDILVFLTSKYGDYDYSNATMTRCPYTTTHAMISIFNTQEFYRTHDYREWVLLDGQEGVLIDWVHIGDNVDWPSLVHFYLSYRLISTDDIVQKTTEIVHQYNKLNTDL